MTPLFLVRLMQTVGLGPMKHGPEDLASMDFATRLRVASLDGTLRGTWTKIPHEVGGVSPKSPMFRKMQARYAKQIAMGLIAGSGDFVFVWPGDGAWIELKSKVGSLTDSQRDFRDWCAASGVRFAMCRSADQAWTKLTEWGAINASGN